MDFSIFYGLVTSFLSLVWVALGLRDLINIFGVIRKAKNITVLENSISGIDFRKPVLLNELKRSRANKGMKKLRLNTSSTATNLDQRF